MKFFFGNFLSLAPYSPANFSMNLSPFAGCKTTTSFLISQAFFESFLENKFSALIRITFQIINELIAVAGAKVHTKSAYANLLTKYFKSIF
jgi:hypothetical protein